MRSPSGLSSRTSVPRNWTAESEMVRSRWSTAGELWWRKWGKWRRLRLRRSSLLSLPSERPAWGPDRRDWELWSSRGGNWFSSSEIRPVSPDSRSPGGRHRVQTQSTDTESGVRSCRNIISDPSTVSPRDHRNPSGHNQPQLQKGIPSSVGLIWAVDLTPTLTNDKWSVTYFPINGPFSNRNTYTTRTLQYR